MNSGVRLIKRDRAGGVRSAPLNQHEHTPQQRDREIANVVKNWITELAQRRADEHGAFVRNWAQSCALRQGTARPPAA